MVVLRRFSILVLLGFVIFVGCRCYAHHRAVSRIIALDGAVLFDAPPFAIAAWMIEKAGTRYPGYFCPAQVELNTPNVTPEDIRVISSGLNIEAIISQNGSSALLEGFVKSGSCKRVILMGGLFDDESLRALAGSTTLEKLLMWSTDVTDTGLLELKRCPNLKILDIRECENLSVVGASQLLPQLQIEFDGKSLNQPFVGPGGGMF